SILKARPVAASVKESLVMTENYCRRALQLGLWVVGILLAPSLTFAQSTTQSIIGLVTDSTGAVIQGAKVTLTNTGTNVVLTTSTNETGNYSFPLLQVGDYSVRVEAQGFKSEVVRGIRVETALQSRQDVRLDVG